MSPLISQEFGDDSGSEMTGYQNRSHSHWDGDHASSFSKSHRRQVKVKKIKVTDHSISNNFVPKQLNVKNIW